VADDIITRLQEMLDGPVPFVIGREDIREAADEIRRLRKAGDQLAYWALQETLAGELIAAAKSWKAVRGE
jgi:hypothetical protein